MSNDGSGCAGYILGGVLLALVLAAVVAWTGLPTWDGSLGWDTTATAERQLTERERIAQEAQTERERIAANAETSRTWAVAFAVMVTVGSVGAVGIAWSRRPHRPVPQTVTMLLPHYPGHVPELIDGEWAIVNPTTGVYVTEPDAWREVRMLETR